MDPELHAHRHAHACSHTGTGTHTLTPALSKPPQQHWPLSLHTLLILLQSFAVSCEVSKESFGCQHETALLVRNVVKLEFFMSRAACAMCLPAFSAHLLICCFSEPLVVTFLYHFIVFLGNSICWFLKMQTKCFKIETRTLTVTAKKSAVMPADVSSVHCAVLPSPHNGQPCYLCYVCFPSENLEAVLLSSFLFLFSGS